MLNKNKSNLLNQKNTSTKLKEVSPTRKPNQARQDASNQNKITRCINIESLLENESKINFPCNDSELFEDKFFCTNANLSNDFKTNLNIEWLRPKEIIQNYSIDYDESGHPLQQQLGDCWFVCACYALFSKMGNSLFKNICVENNSGKLKFRFYAQGASNEIDKFIQVTIDDRLPVKKANKQLIYGCCADLTKFWFPLLEKAYCKLYGSVYENIVAGIPEEAFIDISGAFTLYLDPRNSSDIQLIIEKCFELKKDNKLIACADTIPLKATVNSSRITLETKRSHTFVIVDINNHQDGIIIQLKNLWASSNLFFKDLWNLNCKKNKINNEFDYADLHLKLKDFQIYFGAFTFALYIPDYSKPINEFTEFSGVIKKAYSIQEINNNNFKMKDLFINYLLETNEFYLLEACHSFELLFNFTQYGSGSEREKLRLCFIELDKNMVANYSNRIETNRNGRTLSKILTWKSDKPVVYLILAMVVSCEARSLKYIFRCLHKELKKK